jgi:sensor histidine kinase YesM
MLKRFISSIRGKIIIIIVLGCLLPILLQILQVSTTIDKLLNNQVYGMANQSAENTALHITDLIQAQYDMVWFFKKNPILINGLKSLDNQNEKELNNIRSQINNALINENIERYSYPFHYILFDYKGNMMTNYTFTPFADYHVIYSSVKDTAWFTALKRSYTDETMMFINQSLLNSYGGDYFYIAMNVFDGVNSGILVIAMNKSIISKQLLNTSSDGEAFILLNNEEPLMNGYDNTMDIQELNSLDLNTLFFEYNNWTISSLKSQRYVIFDKTLIVKGYGEKINLVTLLDQRSLTSEALTIQATNIFVISLAMFSLVLVVILLNRNIVKPILILRNAVQEVSSGNLETKVSGLPNNELGQLGAGFNTMISTINQNVKDIKINEENKRKIEIRLLQNQIKPHFVRNILNTIRWLAEINGAKGVSKAISALSNLLEYNFRDTELSSTVSEELAYVKKYVFLQKLRFQNKFKDEYDIDERLMNLQVLKLIFQPIVENSIYHGLLTKTELGTIKITGRIVDNKMVFVISDDGTGMPESIRKSLLDIPELESIHDHTKENENIALWNINQRIQRQFGSSYGLSVQSIQDEGTQVTLSLPIDQNVEEL